MARNRKVFKKLVFRMSDQGEKPYTIDELYEEFPRFFSKENVDLRKWLEAGAHSEEDLLLVCSWGLTLSSKKSDVEHSSRRNEP